MPFGGLAFHKDILTFVRLSSRQGIMAPGGLASWQGIMPFGGLALKQGIMPFGRLNYEHIVYLAIGLLGMI